jgi:pilus assembly protein CpaC
VNRAFIRCLASSLLLAASPLTSALAADALPELKGVSEQRDVVIPSAVGISLGQTRLFDLPEGISRIVIADKAIADFRLLSPRQFYLLGKTVGRTNLLVWQNGKALRNVVVDVGIDVGPLERAVREALPAETGIQVRTSAASIVLDGVVKDAVSADVALRITRTHTNNLERHLRNSAGPNSRGNDRDVVDIVNLLRLSDPQQVMLEVRIAEVARSLADKIGVGVVGGGAGGNFRWSIGSNFAGTGPGGAGLVFGSGATQIAVDLAAEEKRGLVKILAEPALVAMSGTDASFNVGGKIFIPVLQPAGGTGGGGITLEEREFGVGLKFKPTVLENGRINLLVAPEVSEISRESISIGNLNNPTFLPAFTVSRVSTTVQLAAGQYLVIGGLLRNTSFATVKRFPLLGSIPILGALFRSNEYANEQTELLVLVRPTLVSGTDTAPRLPTDDAKQPTAKDRFLNGTLEKGVKR